VRAGHRGGVKICAPIAAVESQGALVESERRCARADRHAYEVRGCRKFAKNERESTGCKARTANKGCGAMPAARQRTRRRCYFEPSVTVSVV